MAGRFRCGICRVGVRVDDGAGRCCNAGALDRRVRLLAKALDLSARQQRELRGILEAQRDAVQKVWSDSSLLPAERAPATHEIGERTADRIRAMLTEEQRKLYNPPRPSTPHETPPDVSKWMTAS